MTLQRDVEQTLGVVTSELSDHLGDHGFTGEGRHVFTKWGMVYIFQATIKDHADMPIKDLQATINELTSP